MSEQFYDKQVIIGEIKKSESTKIAISIVEKKSEDDETKLSVDGLDIREYYKRKDQKEYRPGKGVIIKRDNLQEFISLLNTIDLSPPKTSGKSKEPKKKKIIKLVD